MNIKVYSDEDAVAGKAAAIIADAARAAVRSRGRFTMAVSGGRTPWLMLRALRRDGTLVLADRAAAARLGGEERLET